MLLPPRVLPLRCEGPLPPPDDLERAFSLKGPRQCLGPVEVAHSENGRLLISRIVSSARSCE